MAAGSGTSLVPPEIEERRQFAWPTFKKAKNEKQNARFDGGKFIVNNEHLTKIDSELLPALSKLSLNEASAAPAVFASESIVEAGHRFQTWAVPVHTLQHVRDSYDELVKMDEASMTDHLAYGYRFGDGNHTHEDFDSDGDTNIGLQIIKIMRAADCNDTAIFVSHSKSLTLG